MSHAARDGRWLFFFYSIQEIKKKKNNNRRVKIGKWTKKPRQKGGGEGKFVCVAKSPEKWEKKKGTLNMRMRSEGFRGLESVSDADATIERNSLFFHSFGRPRDLVTLAWRMTTAMRTTLAYFVKFNLFFYFYFKEGLQPTCWAVFFFFANNLNDDVMPQWVVVRGASTCHSFTWCVWVGHGSSKVMRGPVLKFKLVSIDIIMRNNPHTGRRWKTIVFLSVCVCAYCHCSKDLTLPCVSIA